MSSVRLLVLSLTVLFAFYQSVYGLYDQYVELFRDDFDGCTINATKWNSVTVPSQVNGELQYYVADEDFLDGHGNLILQSRNRNYGGYSYTSGRVDTRGLFSFLYGEVEWRAKLPKGQGIWPALWLLRNECPAAVACPFGYWPPEIDVMEARGDLTNKITSTLHYGVYPNNNYIVQDIDGPDYTADFHTYKVLWDPTQVVVYVDGVEQFRNMDTSKIPNVPLYLVMNTAVGGSYPGNPDATTPWPVQFAIDYVTVHQWQ